MFSMLTNLAKAAVSVVAAPVALVVDVVTLPACAYSDSDRGPFGRTGAMLDSAGDALKEAVKVDRA